MKQTVLPSRPTFTSEPSEQPPATMRKRPGARPAKSTKLQETCDRLTALAHELGPDAKLPTVLQLREQLGVSIVTLDDALSRLEAQRVVRRKHGVGIFVASELHQANILLLCDSTFFYSAGVSPFWNLLIQGARERASSDALNVELHFADPVYAQSTGTPVVSEAVATLLDAGQIQGAITIGASLKTVTELEKRGLPLVAFAGPATYTVGLDVLGLVRQGVRALAEAGAKRIGLWCPLPATRPRDNAWAAALTALVSTFEATLTEIGLPYLPELVRPVITAAGFGKDDSLNNITGIPHQEQGYNTAMSVFGSRNKGQQGSEYPSDELPDAILSTDDMLTAGILSALRHCGLRPGIDLKIATHANTDSPVLIGYEHELFFLDVDPSEVVNALFNVLEALMQGQVDTLPSRTRISSRLRTQPYRKLDRIPITANPYPH